MAGARARLAVLSIPGVDCMAGVAPGAGRGKAENGGVLWSPGTLSSESPVGAGDTAGP